MLEPNIAYDTIPSERNVMMEPNIAYGNVKMKRNIAYVTTAQCCFSMASRNFVVKFYYGVCLNGMNILL